MTSEFKDFFAGSLARLVERRFPRFLSRDFVELVDELDELKGAKDGQARSSIRALAESTARFLAYAALAELVHNERRSRLYSGSVSGSIRMMLARRATAGMWLSIARDVARSADRNGAEMRCRPLVEFFRDDTSSAALKDLLSWRNDDAHNRRPPLKDGLDALAATLGGLKFLSEWSLVARPEHGAQRALRGARLHEHSEGLPGAGVFLVGSGEDGVGRILELTNLVSAVIDEGEGTATLYGLQYNAKGYPVLSELGGSGSIAFEARPCADGVDVTAVLADCASEERAFSFGLSSSITLAGREPELKTLRGRIDEARKDGRGQVVMLEGEFGVGKSRILGGLRRWLQDEGIAHRFIAFTHHSVNLPGHALRRLSDASAIKDPAAPTRSAAWETLDQVIRRSPQRSDGGQGAEHSAMHSTDDAGWAEHVDDLADALFAVAEEERGLVVLLDDAHNADSISAGLVSHVAERMRSQPVRMVLIMGVQAEELPESRYLGSAVDRLVGYSGDVFLRMPVRRLEMEALSDLCTNALSIRLSERDTTFFAHMSGGNPLFLVQLLREAHALGALIEHVGEDGATRWELTRNVDRASLMSADLTSAVQRHLERTLAAPIALERPDERGWIRRAAMILSLVGDSIDPVWVAPLLRRSRVDTDAHDVVRVLGSRGILDVRDGVRPLTFSSGFVREVLCGMAQADPLIDVRATHRAAADGMLSSIDHAGGQGDTLNLAAFHYERAGETTLAAKLYELAAARLPEPWSWSAVECLESAVRCLGGPSRETAEIMLRMCDALSTLDRNRERLQLQALLDATTGTQPPNAPWSPDPPLRDRILVRLAVCHKELGHYGRAEAIFDRCRAEACSLLYGTGGLELAGKFWSTKSNGCRSYISTHLAHCVHAAALAS